MRHKLPGLHGEAKASHVLWWCKWLDLRWHPAELMLLLLLLLMSLLLTQEPLLWAHEQGRV